jgi:hypothetical protein
VIETDSKEGQLNGYVKPLFRDLKVFSLTEDIKEDSLLQFFWQALVGATTSILKNPSRDQFGTLIPFLPIPLAHDYRHPGHDRQRFAQCFRARLPAAPPKRPGRGRRTPIRGARSHCADFSRR